MESPNTSPQAIEFNPSCSGQAHSSRPGTGHGYENTEPGCVFTVLRVPSKIRIRTEKRGYQVRQDCLLYSVQLAQTGV